MFKFLKVFFRKAFETLGYRLVRTSSDHDVTSHNRASYNNLVPLPTGARDYLSNENPVLKDLRRRYANHKVAMSAHSHWSEALLQRDLKLDQFRGDNVYVWQLRNVREHARMKYFLFTQYISSLDKRGLLHKLKEDGAFGAWTFQYQDYPLVSRDLLDSINEIYFLDRHIELLSRHNFRVIDIGAGYGRMAHRMLQATDSIERYDCLDAIPESTFLCDYYTRFRGIKANVIPLDQLEKHYAEPDRFDLAINIHSFSEMSYAAIEGWLNLLSRLKPQYLLIVPNTGTTLLSSETDRSRRDCTHLIEKAGYRLKISEPIFMDENVREMMAIDDYLTLYELS